MTKIKYFERYWFTFSEKNNQYEKKTTDKNVFIRVCENGYLIKVILKWWILYEYFYSFETRITAYKHLLWIPLHRKST